MKKIINIIFITLIFYLISDLFFGNYIYKKILRKNYFDIDTGMGEKNPIFHHSLKKNYRTNSAGWGKKRFSFCTDNHGFRNDCNSSSKLKKFDIGIIGDSFTEGFGMNFDETYVGLIKNNLKHKKIANLAVSSYSPSIYYSKINFLLNEGYEFKEIIVFLDLSDLQDDVVRYELNNTIIQNKLNNDWTPINYSNYEKFLQFISRKFKVTNYLIINLNDYLISKNMIQKKIPNWVLTTPRSNWTYDYNKKWYSNNDLETSLKIITKNMELLSILLKKNDIELSIAVYPWPSTIIFDNEKNLQIQVWKKFCEDKCKKFYNLMDPFFILKKNQDPKEIYFKYFIDGDVHFNNKGNKIIADNFLSLYKEN